MIPLRLFVSQQLGASVPADSAGSAGSVFRRGKEK